MKEDAETKINEANEKFLEALKSRELDYKE